MLKKNTFSFSQSYYKYTGVKMVLATLKAYFIEIFLPFSIIIKILCYNESRRYF